MPDVPESQALPDPLGDRAPGRVVAFDLAARAPGRVVAFDLGERRIGVAVSDSNRKLAMAREVVQRSADPAADRRRLVELARELDAVEIVVGLPLSLDGSRGPAARNILAEVEQMAALAGMPVRTWDERLTTVEAHARRREVGAAFDSGKRQPRSAGARGGARGARAVVDDQAAAIFLQGYLDALASSPPGTGSNIAPHNSSTAGDSRREP